MDCAAPRHGDEPREAHPGTRLCIPCAYDLRSDLRKLPLLARQLEAELDPRRGHGPYIGGDGDGLPYHDPASECLSQIRHDAEVWVKRVLTESRADNCPVLTIPAMTGWLAGWVKWILGRDWAGHMAGAFSENRGRASAILNPRPRAVITIPPEFNYCPPNHGGCGHAGAMYATVFQAADDKRPPMVTCGNCWHEWDTIQWLRLGETMHAWHREQRAAA